MDSLFQPYRMASASQASVPLPHTHVGCQHNSEKAHVHNGPSINLGFIDPNKERIAILNWLSPLRSSEAHDRVRTPVPIQSNDAPSLTGDYTGKWLLESNVFDNWTTRKISHLWYHGMPGAGKTVLASVVIEHMLWLTKNLIPTPEASRRKVAFLYLTYEHTPIQQLVGSVVRQIIEDEHELPEVVVQAYKNDARNGGSSATETQLTSLLCDLSSQWPVYIILDALDEYRNSTDNAEAGSICKRLLKCLIPSAADERSISMLITSRLLDEFNDLSKKFHRVNIRANDRDIAIFIDHEFNNNSKLQKYAENDPDMLERVKEAITRRCGGMFLLAHLHMKTLGSQLTESDLENQLRNLPGSIDATYDMIVKRLRRDPMDAKRDLAWNSLAWIVLSQRRLQTAELQHALACTRRATKLDPREFYNLGDVQEFSEGLVEYSNSTVALVHYTAQAYFQARADQLFAGFQNIIAKACIRYISFFSFDAGSDGYSAATIASADTVQRLHQQGTRPKAHFIPSNTPLHALFQNFPFLQYAIMHLKYHLDRQSEDQTPHTSLTMLIELFNDQEKRKLLLYALQKLHLYPTQDEEAQEYPLRIRRLYSTSSCNSAWSEPGQIAWGSENLELPTARSRAEDLIGEELRGSSGDMQHNHYTESPDDNLESSDLLPAPSETLWRSHRATFDNEQQDGSNDSSQATLESILEPYLQGISVNIGRDSAREDVASIMDQEEEMDSPSGRRSFNNNLDEYWTWPDDLQYEQTLPREAWLRFSPLHLAVCLGWTPLVRHLVESSDDINSTDGNGLTSIGIAARTGNFEAVEVILSHRDAFVDLSTTEGHSVLLNLAQNQRTDLIDRILSGTLSPLLFDSVPLILQVWNFLFAKGLLLLWGVKIYWRSWVPRPVTHQQHCCLSHLKLLAAAHRGYLSEVRELFDSKRIDLIVAKRFATTAIHLAVASHKVDVVEYLIDHGVDIDSLGSQKMTPLHLATRANALVMVEMLLKKGASIRAKDQDGKPAWMASLHTDKGREMMKKFIEAGVDLNSFEPDGGTVLYSASCAGDIELVRFLLDNGADPSRRTRYDWAPLHYAAHNGRLDCVLALLDAGAELSPMSDQSKTPLDMAIYGKQGYIAKLLRDQGAKTAEEVYLQQSTDFSRSEGRAYSGNTVWEHPLYQN